MDDSECSKEPRPMDTQAWNCMKQGSLTFELKEVICRYLTNYVRFVCTVHMRLSTHLPGYLTIQSES